MGEHKSEKNAATPWHVPVVVEQVPETGEHFDLVADVDVRVSVARLAGLRDLPRFQANFDVTRRGAGGLSVIGQVSATVGQTCVVTLEPVANEIEEAFDLVFVLHPTGKPRAAEGDANGEPREVKWNDPEPLIGGVIDLGAIATEFLILGLNPYPRKPGATFQPPPNAKSDGGPFAALAKLKKDQDGR